MLKNIIKKVIRSGNGIHILRPSWLGSYGSIYIYRYVNIYQCKSVPITINVARYILMYNEVYLIQLYVIYTMKLKKYHTVGTWYWQLKAGYINSFLYVLMFFLA